MTTAISLILRTDVALTGLCDVDIDDDDHRLSVTNNPQAVYNKIIDQGIDMNSRKLIYKDTEGRFDELVFENNHFKKYKFPFLAFADRIYSLV